MSNLIITTTKSLVEEYNALLGRTQSDEISLVFYSGNYKSQIPYDGKIQKMIGNMAAGTSVIFNSLIPAYIPEKKDKLPRFDCRVWNVPNKEEAANTILWRELDTTKNSISMATRALYSHKEMQGLGRADQMDMLIKKGINWNNYPDFFKRGTFIQKLTVKKKLSHDEIDKLPLSHNARKYPDLEIKRSKVCIIKMPSFSEVENRIGVIFDGEEPVKSKNNKKGVHNES